MKVFVGDSFCLCAFRGVACPPKNGNQARSGVSAELTESCDMLY